MLPYSKHVSARWSPLANPPSRGLVVRSCLSCILRAALLVAVASRFSQLFTWHFRVLTRHLPTRSTRLSPSGRRTPDTVSVNLDLLACLRHQMLLICWHVVLVLDQDLVLSMANSALNCLLEQLDTGCCLCNLVVFGGQASKALPT